MNAAFGVASILVQAALVTGLVLLVTARWALPFGSLTLVLTLNAALVSFLNDQFSLLPAAVVAGLAADLLLRKLRPFEGASLVATRLFAFAVPAVLYSAYFAALAITQGVGWTVHLWAGSAVLAGIVGWLLSYLATSGNAQEG
jgi:hypothetical protein